MKLFFISSATLILTLFALPLFAQSLPITSLSTYQQATFYSKIDPPLTDNSKWQTRLGIAGAFGNGVTSASLAWSKLYGFGNYQRFRLGYGARLSSFFGTDREFMAVPTDLSDEDNTDKLSIAKSQINAINFGLYTDFAVTDGLLIGFNIDFIGFSFGGQKNGTVYQKSGNTLISISDDTATPSSFNALLIGDNYGTLNSEFWAGYRITSTIIVRGGFSYLFTEYTTTGRYKDDNDHFRHKAAMGFVGVNYIL